MSQSDTSSSAAKVFGNYDQAALDAQYNNRAAVPDHAAVIAAWKADSGAARSRLAGHLDLAYGPNAKTRLDIFPAAGAVSGNVPGGSVRDGSVPDRAPVLAFIHGGYWQALDKSDFSCLAPFFNEAGITLAVIGYPLCPQATMREIVEHCQAAMGWLHYHIADHGGDPDRLFLSGHSAGGHLSALLSGSDWTAAGLPADLLKGAIPLSGLYELEPIRLSYLNEGVRLTPEDVRHYSPSLQTAVPACPLLLAVGGAETDEFLRQQRDYTARLTDQGCSLQSLEPTGLNHFTIVEAFRTAGTALSDAVLKFIKT
jgi:arylformamidase